MQEENTEGANDALERLQFSRSLQAALKTETSGASLPANSTGVPSASALTDTSGESQAEWKQYVTLQQAETSQLRRQIAELERKCKAAIDTSETALDLAKDVPEKFQHEIDALRNEVKEAQKDAERQKTQVQDLRSGWQSRSVAVAPAICPRSAPRRSRSAETDSGSDCAGRIAPRRRHGGVD